MHLEVTFRNLNPREEVRRRAEALFAKVERFLDEASDAQLNVAVEHGNAIVEIVVVSRGTTYKVAEENEDLKAAVDLAFHTLENQLRRGKEKRIDRKRGADEQDGFAEDDGAPA